MQNLNERILNEESIKFEAIDFLDDIISIANISELTDQTRHSIIENMHKRSLKLENQWKNLIELIELKISDLKTQRHKRLESVLSDFMDVIGELEMGVKASAEATDAEELSEYLDVNVFLLKRMKLYAFRAPFLQLYLLLLMGFKPSRIYGND